MNYFLASPEEFSVDYVINPWMDGQVGELNKEIAMKQWLSLKSILEKKGINVYTIPCTKKNPDIVFTANSAIAHNGKVVVANFTNAERKGETPINIKFFETLYAPENILILPENIFQEGAGDALLDRNLREKSLLFAGSGFRSQRESYPLIQDFLDIEIEILELIHPEYYHLDISLAPLDGGHLIYAPQSFTDESVAKIEKNIPKEKRIILSQKDLDAFNGNAVNIGETVIVNNASSQLTKDLNDKGYEVINNNISEFKKSGGGNKCLTLRLE